MDWFEIDILGVFMVSVQISKAQLKILLSMQYTDVNDVPAFSEAWNLDHTIMACRLAFLITLAKFNKQRPIC